MSIPLPPGVFVTERRAGVDPIVDADTSTTAFVGHFASGPVDAPTKVSSFSEFEAQYGGLHSHSEASYGVWLYFQNGGERAVILRVAASAPDSLPSAHDLIAALPTLDGSDYSLLCVPAMSRMDDADFETLVAFLNRFCDERGSFLLIDPNTSDHIDDVGDFDMRVGTRNNALFFPHLEVTDPLAPRGSRLRRLPPSGAVAGIYARTDSRRGVWKAPAGTDARIMGARIAGRPLDDLQIQSVHERGINVLRELGGSGLVWGARTGDGASSRSSEWRYVPVRRFALFIERSVERGLQWAVFEPNGAPLWSEIDSAVRAFLDGLFRAGALQGTRESDAYFVRIGRETMTEADISQGIVRLEIGVAPLKPAEFVIVRVQLQAAVP